MLQHYHTVCLLSHFWPELDATLRAPLKKKKFFDLSKIRNMLCTTVHLFIYFYLFSPVTRNLKSHDILVWY